MLTLLSQKEKKMSNKDVIDCFFYISNLSVFAERYFDGRVSKVDKIYTFDSLLNEIS